MSDPASARRPSMAERLEALLPEDGLRDLVFRLEQLKAQKRVVEEECVYRTDTMGEVVELRVVRSHVRRRA